MAIDDLSILRDSMPDLFEDRTLPSDWENNWSFAPLPNPRKARIEDDFEAEMAGSQFVNDDQDYWEEWSKNPFPLNWPSDFPGAPRDGFEGSQYPPTEISAFYLPFHFYYPRWWGIYLIADRVRQLQSFIRWHSQKTLSHDYAWAAARLFLYWHESFHHQVECFATRLEVVHRHPLYKIGFQDLYRTKFGSDSCREEALANGYALCQTLKSFDPRLTNKSELQGALLSYVISSPPGYRKGVRFVQRNRFEAGRNRFAEQCLNWSLKVIRKTQPNIWSSFPHAFTGMNRIDGRANYLVHKNSPFIQKRLWQQMNLLPQANLQT